MPLLTWQDEKHRLGHAAMDATHREFAALLNRLGDTADPDAFRAGFADLVAHTQAHFDAEDALMVESAFPATGEHRSEHRRILGQLAQIDERVQKGRLRMGREYIKELPAWFDLHAATMDSALAAHLKTRGPAAGSHDR
jgi:hemerythrin-like metal-binding protein